jgi:hypothetical protein
MKKKLGLITALLLVVALAVPLINPSPALAAPGDIGSVIDTQEFDTSDCRGPSIVRVADDVVAIAYSGPGDDGWLKTYEIDASGNITDTVIDSLEFDTSDCYEPSITHVLGEIYAIAYRGPGDDGWLKTVDIDGDGNIGAAVIDSQEFDGSDGREPSIVRVADDVVAIAYRGPNDDGWLKTYEVDASGSITNTAIDSLEFDTGDGREPSIAHVLGEIYAIAYRGPGDDGWLKSVDIDGDGNIGAAVIDSQEFDSTDCRFPSIVRVADDVVAIAYMGPNDDGWLKTYEIDASGNITNTAMDSLEFDTDNGLEPSIAQVSVDIYAIAYAGYDDDGWLKTYEIDTSGNITDTVIDTLEFDTTYGVGPSITHVLGDIWAIAYRGPDYDGFLKTVGIESCTNYWHDVDGDGYGGGDPECLDTPPGYDYALVGGDCDDTNDQINPGMTEIECNSIDDDCNPATEDNPADNDGDGYGICDGDCDDNDATINPGALEVCDGKDNDCDGDVDDADSDFIPLKVQLAMILDGSGSISGTEWNIMVTGLAQSLNDTECVPHDGSVELTVIQFSDWAQVELGPVVITAANAAELTYEITQITQLGDSTCISCGLCLAADTLAASPCFDTSLKQAINLVTDGEPNRCSCAVGAACGYSGTTCNTASAQASAVCARDYLISTLGMTEEQDEIDVEGIGITDANRDWLKNNIIFPATGYSNPPEGWPPPAPGWVRVFDTFEEFVPSLCEKFQAIIAEEYSLMVVSDGCCPITVGTLGSVNASDSDTFTVVSGTNVTLTVDDSDPCCVFDYWTGNVTGAPNSTNPITITMDGDKTVTATCHWLSYNLTVESDGCCPITVGTLGSVDPGKSDIFTVPCGTNVTLTATNSSSCGFTQWTVDDVPPANGSKIITVHMDANHTATAVCNATAIGDTVFYDNNNNGTQDPGEGGVAGVQVELYEDDGDGVFEPGTDDQLVGTNTTGGDGKYEFTGIEAGCYWVRVDESTLPTGVTLPPGSNPYFVCPNPGEFRDDADFPALTQAPPPVGGEAYPISKFLILLPWIALGAAIVAGLAILARRRRVQS